MGRSEGKGMRETDRHAGISVGMFQKFRDA